MSSDVFFYQLGQQLNTKDDGLVLQRWARRLGVGRKTGIDLPEELPGRIPTPAWRNRGYQQYQRCVKKEKPSVIEIQQGMCGLLRPPWSVGDNINLSVGQGDIAANPLQMAVAYATVANGGKVLRPRLGLRIEDSTGRALQQLEAPTARRVEDLRRQPPGDPRRHLRRRQLAGRYLDPGVRGLPDRDRRQDGHGGEGRGAGRTSPGTSRSLPTPTPSTSSAVTDEAGGFGADTAAPLARRIMAELFNVDEDGLVEGGGAPD